MPFNRYGIILVLLCAGALGLAAQAAQAASPPGGDPFAYCARIGTIDEPAGGFAPSPIPPALIPYLKSVFGTADVSAAKPELFYWRCMDKAVYVCAVGANLPCGGKADRARRNRGAEAYCRENRNADAVPAYATGHATIYAWSCSAGRAVHSPAIMKLDRRGYWTDIWHRVSPH